MGVYLRDWGKVKIFNRRQIMEDAQNCRLGANLPIVDVATKHNQELTTEVILIIEFTGAESTPSLDQIGI
jgi:hypothetical protein